MSSTSHVIEIRFVSNTQGALKPTVDLGKGVDTLNKSTTTLNKTAGQTTDIYSQAQKSGEQYFKTTGNVTKGTASANKELSNTAKAGNEVVQANTKMASAQDKTTASKGKMINTFTKFRPLIFGATGIATAGIEAVGMWGQYQSAAAKVSKAQETVNMLIASGQQGTSEYKQAMNDLTDANRSAQFAMRILILSVSDLAPMLLLSVNAMLNMKQSLAEAKMGTDALSTSTTNLANAKKASLIPAFTDFNTIASKTPILNANVTKSLDTTTKSVVAQKGPLAALGAAGVSAFGTIETSVRSQDSQLKKSQGVFGTFKTALMSGFTGLIGGFKAAGTAVAAFGKALLGVFMSNPILLIIGAIATAIGALIFDLGGFRTRLNEVGITLGQMAPWAKPFLDILGGISKGLEGVGGSIMHMLGLGDATKKAGQEAQAAANKFDPLLLSMQKVLDVGQNFERLNIVTAQLDNVKTSITNMTVETEKGSGIMKSSIGNVANAFETFQASVTSTSPTVIAAEQAVRDAIRDVETGVVSKADAQEYLTGKYDAYLAAISGARKEEESQIVMYNQATIGAKGLSAEVIALTASLKDEEVQQGALAEARQENNVIIEKWADDMGITTEMSNKLMQSVLDNVPAIKAFGTQVVITDQDTVDLTQTILNVVKANEDLRASAVDIWGTYMQQVNQLGSKYLPTIQPQIDLIKQENEALGEILQTMYDDWKENIVEVNGQIYIQNEAVEEEAKANDKSSKSIQEKAEKLGIWSEIAGKSTAIQEQLISLEDTTQKAQQKSTETLKQLASARGASTEMLLGNIDNLQEYVMHTEAEIDVDKEVGNQLAILMAARQDEANATTIQTHAAQQYAKELGVTVDVTEMSADAIMELIDLEDDMHNARQLAIDDVQLWQQELKTTQAVEQATTEELILLADTLGIDIPQSILDEGIPAIKEYIEAQQGIGEGAKKAAKDAEAAFDSLANKANDTIANLIKEDVLKGKGKAVEKTLEEIGLAVDSLAAKRAIIEVGANTVDFEDKIQSIDELIITELQGIPPKTTVEADHIITTFADSMEEELGSRIPGIGQTINDLWTHVKTENAGKSASEMLKIFQDTILKDPAMFEKAVQAGIIDPSTGALDKGFTDMSGMTSEDVKGIAEALGADPQAFTDAAGNLMEGAKKGFEAGGHLFETEGQAAKYKWLLAFEGKAAAEAYAAGKALPENAASGISQNATLVTDAAGNLVTGVGGKMMLIENEANTATAPVPGIFSQAFLDASNAAGTQLQTMVTNVHTKMSSMSTSVDTYSESMKVNFADFLTVSAANVSTFIPSITNLQTAFSTLSTSVATYSTSMLTTFAAFITATTESIGAFIPAIQLLQGTFSTLSTSVATYATSMTTNLQAFVDTTTESFTTYSDFIVNTVQQTFSTLSTSMATYMESMTVNTENFTTTSTENLTALVDDGVTPFHESMSKLSTSVDTYANSMATNIEDFEQRATQAFQTEEQTVSDFDSFMSTFVSDWEQYMDDMINAAEDAASDISSAFGEIESAADSARSAIEAMIRAAEKAKSAASGLQFGGHFQMQKGGSFIADHFMRYGGHSIGEYGKSELVTNVSVNPITDPYNISQKSPLEDTLGLNNFFTGGTPSSDRSSPPNLSAMSSNVGNARATPNITFTGQAHITIVSPNGEKQAKIVAPLVFKNVTSINLR